MSTSASAFPGFREASTHQSVVDNVAVQRSRSKPSLEMWNELAAGMSSEHAWLAAIWQAGIEDCVTAQPGWDGPYEYLTVRGHCDAVLGILPFARQRYKGLSFLSLAGLYEPHRGLPVVAHSGNEIATALVDAFDNSGPLDCLRFGPVPETDVMMSRIRSELEQRGWKSLATVSERAIIDLPSTYDEYQSQFSKRKLKSLRRCERKLHREHADVHAHKYTRENCSDWGEVIADLAVVEKASWLEHANGNLRFAPAHLAELWERLFSLPTPQIEPYAWVIYVRGEPVAFNVGFDVGQLRHEIAGHHCEDFRAYSLGFLLDWYQIKDAFDRGIRSIDMGQGDGGYKQVWQAQCRVRQNDFVFFPPGMLGSAMHALARAAKRKCQ